MSKMRMPPVTDSHKDNIGYASGVVWCGVVGLQVKQALSTQHNCKTNDHWKGHVSSHSGGSCLITLRGAMSDLRQGGHHSFSDDLERDIVQGRWIMIQANGDWVISIEKSGRHEKLSQHSISSPCNTGAGDQLNVDEL